MKYILLLSSILSLFGCQNQTNKGYEASLEPSEKFLNSPGPDHPGKELLEKNCYACHNPTTSHADRIGPPMIAIKKHYINENTTKEDFINAIIDWTKEPSEEKSKMPGAIRRFNLMPYQSFPIETIREIADYIYDYEIEEPAWFEDHFQEGKGRGMQSGKVMGKGMGKGFGNRMGKGRGQNTTESFESLEKRVSGYVVRTKNELGKNLMGTIQKKGAVGALEFCNINAIRLTDSMANRFNAKIKRVTDKPRNPENRANVLESHYIETFKKQAAAGAEMEPIVNKQGREIQFYYPIVTNSLCLQCHGSPKKDIKPLTLAKISELYTEDKATGYNENEVRGIWKISITEK